MHNLRHLGNSLTLPAELTKDYRRFVLFLEQSQTLLALARSLLSSIAMFTKDELKAGELSRGDGNLRLAPTVGELFGTIVVVAALMALTIARFGGDGSDLVAVCEGLASDLRVARMQATLDGARFRFEVDQNRYTISRLTKSGRDRGWNVDLAFEPKTVALPEGCSVTVDSAQGSAAEFDSRGLLVPRSGSVARVVSVTLSNADGDRETLRIWPSGQINSATLS